MRTVNITPFTSLTAWAMQARTQGVRWVRTNPPLRSQLQNDSAPFLNKLSINNREFGYIVKMRLFYYVKHIIVEKIANQSSNCSKKISYLIRGSHLSLCKSAIFRRGGSRNAVDA